MPWRYGVLAEDGQPVVKINRQMSEALMSKCDLVACNPWTGRCPVVPTLPAAPAYGVGAGNATMIWDETAASDLHHAADNTMRSKTSDFGSGCSADGNVIIHETEHLGCCLSRNWKQ